MEIRRALAVTLIIIGGSSFALTVGMLWMHFSMMGSSPLVMASPMFFFIILTLAAMFGGYLLMFPRIEETKTSPVAPKDRIELIMRLLKPDERQVLECILSSGGRCVQRDISKTRGISRLKVHRAVVRLSQSGLIVVKKYGNTNELSVPEWLVHAEQIG